MCPRRLQVDPHLTRFIAELKLRDAGSGEAMDIAPPEEPPPSPAPPLVEEDAAQRHDASMSLAESEPQVRHRHAMHIRYVAHNHAPAMFHVECFHGVGRSDKQDRTSALFVRECDAMRNPPLRQLSDCQLFRRLSAACPAEFFTQSMKLA